MICALRVACALAIALGLGASAHAERAPGLEVRAFWRRVQPLAREAPAASTFFEPLRDGRLAFQRRLELVRGARSSIVGTVYAIDHDAYGAAFLEALTGAARRGVRVAIAVDRTAQLVYDVRASRDARRRFRERLRALERAGGTVAWYGGLAVQIRRPGTGIHFKALVADGRDAIADGRNVGHEYVERWTDFGARLRGPVVGELGREVLRLLERCRPYRGLAREMAARRARYAGLLRDLGAEIDAADRLTRARVIERRVRPRGPRFTFVAWDPLGDERSFWPRANGITEALARAVEQARREVTLSSNFVHAGTRLRRALIAAARRGVRVRIVTTGEAASEVSPLPYLITSAHYRGLVEAGCEIYETTRMEHGKLYLFDGKVGAFGSYNASKVSDARNAEGLLFTADRRVVREIRGALEETIALRSVRYVPRPPSSLRDVVRRAVQWPLRLISL